MAEYEHEAKQDEKKLTILAFPFLNPSSVSSISAFSFSSKSTSAIKSAVLNVDVTDASVYRRVLAVAFSAAVCVRRLAISASRVASCSVVHVSVASYIVVRLVSSVEK